jgi:hypothetical protein
MFVIMAVDAEVFPVRTVRRIVHRVPIFVMNGQEMSIFVIKFSSASGADEAMDLKGPLAIRPMGIGRLLELLEYLLYRPFTTLLFDTGVSSVVVLFHRDLFS